MVLNIVGVVIKDVMMQLVVVGMFILRMRLKIIVSISRSQRFLVVRLMRWQLRFVMRLVIVRIFCIRFVFVVVNMMFVFVFLVFIMDLQVVLYMVFLFLFFEYQLIIRENIILKILLRRSICFLVMLMYLVRVMKSRKRVVMQNFLLNLILLFMKFIVVSLRRIRSEILVIGVVMVLFVNIRVVVSRIIVMQSFLWFFMLFLEIYVIQMVILRDEIVEMCGGIFQIKVMVMMIIGRRMQSFFMKQLRLEKFFFGIFLRFSFFVLRLMKR